MNIKKNPMTIWLLLTIIASTFVLHAFSTGITGRTMKNTSDPGCNCHSLNPSGNVTVVIDGPSLMNTGETANFTVTITGGPLSAAGTNIAASTGTLNVVAGLQKISQELTHTSPKAASGGSVVFEFSYTAPATAGDIILYANGNSVNLNGQNTGDQWNFASNKTVTVQTPTDVDDENIVNAFKLEQNYPNPFNPTTRIDYRVGEATDVVLKVFSSSGEEVTTLVNEFKSAGSYSLNFDAAGLSSGVYYYRLTANNFIETRKFVLMK